MSLLVLFPAVLAEITGAGDLEAQAASADGAGVSSSAGTGTPTAQAAIVEGEGISSSTGSGTPASQASTVDGAGESAWTGTGALSSQVAAAEGDGVSSSTGSSALAAQAASVDGEGVSSSTGSGELVAQGGDVAGLGSAYTPNPDACKLDSTVTTWDSIERTFDETTCAAPVEITGSGAMVSAVSAIDGDGISGSTGTGALSSQSATVAGSGGEITGSGELESSAATVSGSGEISGGLVIFDLVDHATPEVLKVVRGDGSLRAPRARVRGNGSVLWNDDNERFLMMAA